MHFVSVDILARTLCASGIRTMPMDGGFYCQVVLNEDFKVIPFFSFDKRTGLLVVDEIHLPRNSICTFVNRFAQDERMCAASMDRCTHTLADIPGALTPL